MGEHAITYDKLRFVTYSFIAALLALALVVAGIPVGFAVFTAAAAAAGDGQTSPTHTAAGLILLMPATLLLVAILTAIPSGAAARRPAIEALRTD